MSNTSRMMLFAAAGTGGDAWTLNDVKKPFAPIGQVFLDAGEKEQVAWKSDGTYFFQIQRSGLVTRYAGTDAWETYPATSSTTEDLSAQDTEMCGLAFKTDGTKMYTTGQVNSKVYEYNLSVAWDISTASFVQDYALSFGTDIPTSIVFSSDGLNMFVSRNGATDGVYSYSLSSAWDISTASAVTSKAITNAWGIAFNDTGTELFVALTVSGVSSKIFYSYTLGTPWDLSTAGSPTTFNDATWYANGTGSTASTSKQPRHISFKSDGEKMFLLIADTTTGNPTGLYNYDLPNPFSFTGATRQLAASNYYDWPSLYTGTNSGKGGLCFNTNGTSLYVADSVTSTVDQFDLSVAYDISTATYASQINSAYDSDVAISRDGALLFAGLSSGVGDCGGR